MKLPSVLCLYDWPPRVRDSLERHSWLVFVVYLGLLVAGFLAHDPWRDEIQAWNMARDMSVWQLLGNAGYEGHPIGWHLLIKSLTLLGLPFTSLRVTNLAIALAVGAMFFFRAPFSLLLRSAVIFSAPLVFFGFNTRVYGLVLLMLTFQACLHRARLTALWRYALVLGVLANTVVVMLPYTVLSGVYWVRSARKKGRWHAVLPAATVLAAACVASLFQVMPPLDKAQLMLTMRWTDLVHGFRLADGLGVAVVLVVLMKCRGAIKYVCRALPEQIVIGAVTGFFFLIVHFAVYALSVYHFYVFLGVVWALYWMAWEDGNTCVPRPVWSVVAVLGVALGMQVAVAEFTRDSSNLTATVPYFKTRLAEVPVAGHTMSKVSSLLAFVPGKQIWNAATGQWSSYAVFDASWQKRKAMTVPQAAAVILAECDVRRPVCIFTAPWDECAAFRYCLVFHADRETLFDESFYVYMPLERFVECFREFAP